MTAKRKIARYFRRNTGTRLNPLLSTATACGAVVDLDADGDVDFVGELATLGVALPELQGGTAVFPDFAELGEREYSGQIKASLNEAIPLGLEVQDAIAQASAVSVSFSDSVDVCYVDIISLSLNIAKRLDELARAGDTVVLQQLRRFLRPDAGNRVVGAVYSGTIKLHAKFDGEGKVGFGAKVYDKVGGSVGFKWKQVNERTLETDRPVPFAFDAWKWARGRLRDTD